MASNYLILIIIAYISFVSGNEEKIMKIENLESIKYFVFFDSKISIYNSNFTLIKEYNNNLKIENPNSIFLRKHTYKDNTYIFCLEKDHLFIYDNSKETIIKEDISDI